jgi:hypothetical protein
MNRNHFNLSAILKTYKSAILERWERRLSLAEKFEIYQLNSSVVMALSHMIDDLASSLNREGCYDIGYRQPMPLHGVIHQVKIILLGETVIAEFLREHLNLSAKRWLAVRRQINRVFHEILCSKLATACDLCKSARNEDVAQADRLAFELEDAMKKIKKL